MAEDIDSNINKDNNISNLGSEELQDRRIQEATFARSIRNIKNTAQSSGASFSDEQIKKSKDQKQYINKQNPEAQTGGLQSKNIGKKAPKGVRGINIVQDAKDVSRGLESTGSALSGDYKKMDESLKKQSDIDTAQGIKTVAGYTGIGKPIVMGIDTAEQIPIAGGVVKFAERKIGKTANKTLSSVGKMSGAGKSIGDVAKNLGGAGSQGLGGEKAAYDQKQKSEIQTSGRSVQNIEGKSKLESAGDQMAAKMAINAAKAIPAVKAASMIPGVGAAMEGVAGQAIDMVKDKVKKRMKMWIIGSIGGCLTNPITLIFIFAIVILICVAGFFGAYSGGQSAISDANKQEVCAGLSPEDIASMGINCN